jgi:hypothetical protein
MLVHMTTIHLQNSQLHKFSLIKFRRVRVQIMLVHMTYKSLECTLQIMFATHDLEVIITHCTSLVSIANKHYHTNTAQLRSFSV